MPASEYLECHSRVDSEKVQEIIWQWYDNNMAMIWQWHDNDMAMTWQWYGKIFQRSSIVVAASACSKKSRLPTIASTAEHTNIHKSKNKLPNKYTNQVLRSTHFWEIHIVEKYGHFEYRLLLNIC